MNEKINYADNPEGIKIDGFPDYIKSLEDDNYKITMRDGTYYICEEITFKEIKNVLDRSKGGDGKAKETFIIEGLFRRAIVYPKMDKDSINNLKGSHFFKLQNAFNKIYDIESFLWCKIWLLMIVVILKELYHQ